MIILKMNNYCLMFMDVRFPKMWGIIANRSKRMARLLNCSKAVLAVPEVLGRVEEESAGEMAIRSRIETTLSAIGLYEF